MLRWLGAALLCVGVFVLIRYTVGSRNVDEIGGGDPAKIVMPDGTRQSTGGAKDDLSNRIAFSNNIAELGKRITPVVVPDARLLIIDKQEVPSERDGQLIVIGTEIAPGENVPEDRRYTATIGYLCCLDKNAWRRWKEGDPLEPGQIALYREKKVYKRLEVGDEVRAGQTVALVDPILALNDLAIKLAALEASESDRRASQKTKEEAERRVRAMDSSRQKVIGSVSEDDYQGAKLTARRYAEEEIAKASAKVKAQQELIQAQTIVTKHEIHATISGVIKVIYKNRGDAVKNLEPVLQIQNPHHLRAESLLDVQDARRIRPGTEVIVEATQPIPPKLVLGGHLGEVSCVAVSRGPDAVIVSGSEDQTLRGWRATDGRQLWTLSPKSGLRSVACTGLNAKHNLALAGCTDGTARLLDLDKFNDFIKGKLKQKPEILPLAGRHRGAVHCVAFSPDGTLCATGGEDRIIYLWNTETGERVDQLVHHRAPVTSLQFTLRNQLISAGRDNQLVVWSVEPGKQPALLTWFDHRSGDVPQLGASPDGSRVLFDQGKEIRLLSVDSRQVEGVFRNASSAANFTTMALFDPDGLTVLTNGAAEGRLQLWRTPTRESARAAELRQLIWTRGPATCAAFSPDSLFCVTGTQDHHVLVWPMPERKRDATGRVELLETPIKSQIKQVEGFIDSSNRQVRIWAELDNKDNRLVPGGTATMVVLPEEE